MNIATAAKHTSLVAIDAASKLLAAATCIGFPIIIYIGQNVGKPSAVFASAMLAVGTSLMFSPSSTPRARSVLRATSLAIAAASITFALGEFVLWIATHTAA